MIMAMVLMMMKSTKEDNNLDLKEVCLFSVFFFNCITPFIHGEFTSSSKENDLWRHCFY